MVLALTTCVATIPEKRRPLRVDTLIPDPLFTSTHAITIDAPRTGLAVDRRDVFSTGQ
jgi:hypothetical protein